MTKNRTSKVKAKNSAKPHRPKSSHRRKASKEIVIGADQPSGMTFASLPASISALTGRGNTVRVKSRTKDKSGVETVVLTFHQKLQNLVGRETGSMVLTASDGTPVAGIPVSPYFIGGVLGDVSFPFQQWRIVSLKPVFVPSQGSIQPGTLAIAYQPTVNPSESFFIDEEDGGTVGALYDALLSMASVAAGPVWGPLVLPVGKALKTVLAEAAFKWLANLAPSAVSSTEDSDEYLLSQAVFNAATYGSLLQTFLTANAGALPSGTRPTAPGTWPHSDLNAASLRLKQAARNRAFENNTQTLSRTTQGMIYAALNGPYTGTTVSGLADLGVLYVEGEIELINPVAGGPSESNYGNKGDPLDAIDTDPMHRSHSPADRYQYMVAVFREYLESESARTRHFTNRIKTLCLPAIREIRRELASSFGVSPRVDIVSVCDESPGRAGITLRIGSQTLEFPNVSIRDVRSIISRAVEKLCRQEPSDGPAAIDELNLMLSKHGYAQVDRYSTSPALAVLFADRTSGETLIPADLRSGFEHAMCVLSSEHVGQRIKRSNPFVSRFEAVDEGSRG